MNINELIEDLAKLQDVGYGEYSPMVEYSSGCYRDVSGFSVYVTNKFVKIY